MEQQQFSRACEDFEQSRMKFSNGVADLSIQNPEILQNAGGVALLRPLLTDVVPHIREEAALALGRLVDHSVEAVVMENIVPFLVIFLSKQNCKMVLESILQKCISLQDLEPLPYNTPSNILKHVLCQFREVLHHNSNARYQFVTSGMLKKVMEIQAEPGSPLQEHINAVKSCFPEEILRYNSPG